MLEKDKLERKLNSERELLKSLVFETLIQDLELVLKNFDTNSKGLAFISVNTGLTTKTLRRILNKEHEPSPQTLIKLYQFFTGEKNLKTFLKVIPNPIRERIKKSSYENLFLDEILSTGDLNLEEEFLRCSVVRKIYAFVETGPIAKEFIGFKFGENGLKTAKKMEKSGLLIEKQGQFVKGNSKPILFGEMAYEQSLTMLTNYFDKTKLSLAGENQVTICLASLSPDGFNEWLKIELKAYKEKQEIANNKKYQGHLRAWTTSQTDIMSKQRIYSDNQNEEIVQWNQLFYS